MPTGLPSSSSSSSASASASAAAFFGAPSRLPDMLRDIEHQRDAIRMLEQQVEMLALQVWWAMMFNKNSSGGNSEISGNRHSFSFFITHTHPMRADNQARPKK